MNAHDKLAKLKSLLTALGGVVVGYSGGVDSTFLAAVAHQVLGDRMLAVTARSETYPSSEMEAAGQLAKQLGFRHRFIDTSELGIPGYADNPTDRCFYCKGELFGKLVEIAKQEGLNNVADGANVDDTHDFRPGMKAAAALGVRSLLKEAGLDKAEIRELSHEMGLPTWDKPSFACLASRFPYGVRITKERLKMVGEAEEFLRGKGLRQVRVRYYPLLKEVEVAKQDSAGRGGPALQGNRQAMARIEVGLDDLPRFFETTFRDEVVSRLKEIGFLYVALDLQGYRTGSMNEGL
jgi:uncharacterized protein